MLLLPAIVVIVEVRVRIWNVSTPNYLQGPECTRRSFPRLRWIAVGSDADRLIHDLANRGRCAVDKPHCDFARGTRAPIDHLRRPVATPKSRRPTIFDFSGVSFQDLAVAHYLVGMAQEKKLGQIV
jgi:hypothetical protein